MPQPTPAIPLSVPPQHRQIAGGRSHPAMRSIAALVLREMNTRFGRQPGGYLWAIINPLGMIFMIALAFSFLQSSPPLGTSFILFKATGYMVFNNFRSISSMVGSAMRYSKSLLAFPSVTWIDTLLARMLLNSLVACATTTIILGGIIVFEGLSPVLNWVRILEALALTLLFSFGIGCINCYLSMRIDIWDQAWNIVTAPLMIVSGVILLYENMPVIAREILWYNPLVHLTGMFREGFYATYRPNYVSIPYVLAWSLIPMALGLLLLRRYHRQLMQR